MKNLKKVSREELKKMKGGKKISDGLGLAGDGGGYCSSDSDCGYPSVCCYWGNGVTQCQSSACTR